MESLKILAAVWALFGIPMGLMEAAVWLTAGRQVEMTCAEYVQSGFKARWVKLSDCDTRGRTPIYFSRGSSAGGPAPKQFVPVYAPGQGARAFIYSFNASLGSAVPMPVAGLRQGGLLDALMLRKERALLRERFGVPEDFIVVNADRRPSALMALGFLLSGALGAAFAASLLPAATPTAR